jgi:hypothetical protein
MREAVKAALEADSEAADVYLHVVGGKLHYNFNRLKDLLKNFDDHSVLQNLAISEAMKREFPELKQALTARSDALDRAATQLLNMPKGTLPFGPARFAEVQTMLEAGPAATAAAEQSDKLIRDMLHSVARAKGAFGGIVEDPHTPTELGELASNVSVFTVKCVTVPADATVYYARAFSYTLMQKLKTPNGKGWTQITGGKARLSGSYYFRKGDYKYYGPTKVVSDITIRLD